MRLQNTLTLIFWALFYLFDGGKTLLYILLASTFHESAHLFFYYIWGARISSVEILPYGISAKFLSTVCLSYEKEIIALLSGPFFNLIIALFCLFLNNIIFIAGLDLFFVYNLAYFLLNILPIFPLDGGRSLKCFLLKKLPYKRAEAVSKISSLLFLLILFVFALFLLIKLRNISLILISAYLFLTFFIKPQ